MSTSNDTPPAEPEGAVELVDCWRCGEFCVSGAIFCPLCQARLAADSPDASRARAKRDGMAPIFKVIIVYSVMLAASVIWGWVLHTGDDRHEEPIGWIVSLEVFDAVLTLILALWVGRLPGPSRGRSWTALAWLLAVPAQAAVLAISLSYHRWIERFVRWPEWFQFVPFFEGLSVFNVLCVAVQPAIVEEVFFRYLALGALRQHCGTHAAVWVSAVMFAVAHIYAPLGLPWLLVAGVVFGYARVGGGVGTVDDDALRPQSDRAVSGRFGMIGERIESRQGFPVVPVLLLLLCAGLLSVAFAWRSYHPALAALLPLLMALAILVTRPKPFAALVEPTALRIETPPMDLEYAAIDELVARGPRHAPELRLIFVDNAVIIPGRLNVPSADLLQFLSTRISRGGSRDVNTRLTGFLDRQVQTFGDDKVFSFRARRPASIRRYRRAAAVFLAMTAAALGWLAAGIAMGGREFEIWRVLGFLFFLIFGIFALALAFAGGVPKVKNWERSSLVIGPPGLALAQGDLTGEIRWGEVKDVRLRSNVGHGSSAPGIVLVVPGASIPIFDLYDRPLVWIHDVIVRYWRSQDASG